MSFTPPVNDHFLTAFRSAQHPLRGRFPEKNPQFGFLEWFTRSSMSQRITIVLAISCSKILPLHVGEFLLLDPNPDPTCRARGSLADPCRIFFRLTIPDHAPNAHLMLHSYMDGLPSNCRYQYGSIEERGRFLHCFSSDDEALLGHSAWLSLSQQGKCKGSARDLSGSIS